MKHGPRISAGNFCGRRLQSPLKSKVRITTERVRQSLFNIIGEHITKGWFIDAFAGSGVVGLEALSSGAPHAVFVEKDRAVFKMLKNNVDSLKINEYTTLYSDDFCRILPVLIKRITFTTLFIDPPYHTYDPTKLMKLISTCIVNPDALIVIESYYKVGYPEIIGNLNRIRTERYGDTLLSFFTMRELKDQ